MHVLVDLKVFLDKKAEQYNNTDFIQTDPIQIPHQFTKKEDIEISAFLVATIAWGQRKTIINNANKLMQWMDLAPYEFVMNASDDELSVLKDFKHRTFNGDDLLFFVQSLRRIYSDYGGMESLFKAKADATDMKESIYNFRTVFFDLAHQQRNEKHLSNPMAGSAAKRINMFLRWMVRKDNKGVDFGIWESISPALLSCPLDVHTGNIARKLGILKRNNNDWKAVEELDASLRSFDATDPVKYDFALFGLGAFEDF